MLASVDTIFSVLDRSFAFGAEIHFRQFVGRAATTKWMIGADFVVGEAAAVHDTFAFTVYPDRSDFPTALAEINAALPKDIKATRFITEDMLVFLRDPRRFHFCFLLPKDRHERDSLDKARKGLDLAIETIRALGIEGVPGGEERRTKYLRAFQGVRQAANAKSFNYGLLSDIALLSMLAAAIMLWIVRHGTSAVFGLFPDRDKMTSAYNAIFNDMTALNFSSLCQQSGVSELRTTLLPDVSLLKGQDLFYDPLVRMPDYVAGTLSRFDYKARLVTSEHQKHLDLLLKFVSDNPNLAVMQITESAFGMGAANISSWSDSDSQRLLSHMNREQVVEYLAAMALGFRTGRRVSYRQSLLDSTHNADLTFYLFAVLMKGVAAGNPISVEAFRRMQSVGQ